LADISYGYVADCDENQHHHGLKESDRETQLEKDRADENAIIKKIIVIVDNEPVIYLEIPEPITLYRIHRSLVLIVCGERHLNYHHFFDNENKCIKKKTCIGHCKYSKICWAWEIKPYIRKMRKEGKEIKLKKPILANPIPHLWELDHLDIDAIKALLLETGKKFKKHDIKIGPIHPIIRPRELKSNPVIPQYLVLETYVKSINKSDVVIMTDSIEIDVHEFLGIPPKKEKTKRGRRARNN